MTFNHVLLALATVMTWGFSYVVIAWGLQGMPPILFAVLRFVFAAVPLVFWVPRPKVPWSWLLGYACTMFVFQFVLLFAGIRAGLPAGLSSLVIQCQAFFTMGFAALLLDERPRMLQLLGGGIALAGIAWVGWHVPAGGSLTGFGLVVGAGLAWGLGNVLTRRLDGAEPVSLAVWGSLLATPMLVAAAVMVEGPASLSAALGRMSWKSVALVGFQAYPATIFCFAAWSFLLRRYPTAKVAPFSLLVPVFAMTAGVLLLGESAAWWKLGAALLVVGGLAVNQAEGRWRNPRRELETQV